MNRSEDNDPIPNEGTPVPPMPQAPDEEPQASSDRPDLPHRPRPTSALRRERSEWMGGFSSAMEAPSASEMRRPPNRIGGRRGTDPSNLDSDGGSGSDDSQPVSWFSPLSSSMGTMESPVRAHSAGNDSERPRYSSRYTGGSGPDRAESTLPKSDRVAGASQAAVLQTPPVPGADATQSTPPPLGPATQKKDSGPGANKQIYLLICIILLGCLLGLMLAWIFFWQPKKSSDTRIATSAGPIATPAWPQPASEPPAPSRIEVPPGLSLDHSTDANSPEPISTPVPQDTTPEPLPSPSAEPSPGQPSAEASPSPAPPASGPSSEEIEQAAASLAQIAWNALEKLSGYLLNVETNAKLIGNAQKRGDSKRAALYESYQSANQRNIRDASASYIQSMRAFAKLGKTAQDKALLSLKIEVTMSGRPWGDPMLLLMHAHAQNPPDYTDNAWMRQVEAIRIQHR